jgi:hypothetical protein
MLHKKKPPSHITVPCERRQAARFDVSHILAADLPACQNPNIVNPRLTYRLAPKLAPELFLPALNLSS